jgi:hypothetical protein
MLHPAASIRNLHLKMSLSSSFGVSVKMVGWIYKTECLRIVTKSEHNHDSEFPEQSNRCRVSHSAPGLAILLIRDNSLATERRWDEKRLRFSYKEQVLVDDGNLLVAKRRDEVG